MNAITLGHPALPRELFAEATGRTNAWRGRCLDAFTRSEAAVTETLAALSKAGDRGRLVKLPHLVGQRYEALAAAINEGGPFAAEGGPAGAALATFRLHDELRCALCHGVGKVTLDANRRWTVVITSVALRARELKRDIIALTEAEADALSAELVRSSQKVCAQLGQVRALLKA